jgi:hypothetical protein
MLSKKICVVEWFIIVRIGLIVRLPSARAFCMSTTNTESALARDPSPSGLVRASRIMRSECSAREVHSLPPFTMYLPDAGRVSPSPGTPLPR